MSVNLYNGNNLTPIAGIPAMKLTALSVNQAAEEKNLVASRDFEIGEYIIFRDDKIYKVIFPVAAGQPWEIDTNIELTNLGAGITELGSRTADNFSNNVEKSNIASKAYNEGDFLYYIDIKGAPRFACVTSPIALSDSIVNGINVQNTNIGQELLNIKTFINNLTKPDIIVEAESSTETLGAGLIRLFSNVDWKNDLTCYSRLETLDGRIFSINTLREDLLIFNSLISNQSGFTIQLNLGSEGILVIAVKDEFKNGDFVLTSIREDPFDTIKLYF